MTAYLSHNKRIVENWINEFLSEVSDIEPITEAVRYAMSGGKRLRPILCIMAAEFMGRGAEDIKRIAVGLECIHNYSLVHDDLPCMDNDTLRHGKSCTHVKFGEGTGVLAGDALLNLSYQIMLSGDSFDSDYARGIKYIADMAGINGMVGGQCLDLNESNKTEARLSDIIRINSLKTSCLFKASLVGSAITLGADEERVRDLSIYAECLGIIFQIVDDILDVTSTEEELGKNIGSDMQMNKVTYLSLVGMEQAKTDIMRYESQAINAVEKYGANACRLVELLKYLSSRSN